MATGPRSATGAAHGFALRVQPGKSGGLARLDVDRKDQGGLGVQPQRVPLDGGLSAVAAGIIDDPGRIVRSPRGGRPRRAEPRRAAKQVQADHVLAADADGVETVLPPGLTSAGLTR